MSEKNFLQGSLSNDKSDDDVQRRLVVGEKVYNPATGRYELKSSLVNDSSSITEKIAFLEQKQQQANLENIIFDTRTLMENADVTNAERLQLEALVKRAVTDIDSLRKKNSEILTRLAKKDAALFLTDEQLGLTEDQVQLLQDFIDSPSSSIAVDDADTQLIRSLQLKATEKKIKYGKVSVGNNKTDAATAAAASETPVNRVPETAANDKLAPHDQRVITERDEISERAQKAKSYVDVYLSKRADALGDRLKIENGKLTILRYDFIPGENGNTALDAEELKDTVRGNIDFSDGSPVRKVFKDSQAIATALEPILQRKVEAELLAIEKDAKQTDERALKKRIEFVCASEIGNILYTLERYYQEKSSLPNSTSLQQPDKRGIILAAELRRKDGKGEKKAQTLHLKNAYVSTEIVSDDFIHDPDTLKDLQTLTQSSGIEITQMSLEDLKSPLPEFVIRSLEKFVNENGEVVKAISADQMAEQLYTSLENDSLNGVKNRVTELIAYRKIEEYRKLNAELSGNRQNIEAKNSEVEAFLKQRGIASLDALVEKRGAFGLGAVQNQPDLVKRDELAKDLAALENERTQLEAKMREGEPKKPFLPETDLKTQLDDAIHNIELRQIRVKISLEGKTVSSNDETEIDMVLGDRVFSDIQREPIDTLIDRLRERIKSEATRIAESFNTELKATLEKVTKDFQKTTATLQEVMGKENTDSVELTRRMTRDLLLYTQGRVQNASTKDLSLYGDEQMTFYLAGQDSRKEPGHGSVSLIPAGVSKKVSMVAKM